LSRGTDAEGVNGLYIGLISGTSVDGIDAVLARFDDRRCELICGLTANFDGDLRTRLDTLINSSAPSWPQLGSLDVELGEAFANAALDLLRQCDTLPSEVTAIGHHGQTVYHSPSGRYPFTVQIGDPNTVAARTGITTVADLRRYDMALGGQGAPLVPAFHDWLLRSETERRVIVNIGGIANITTLIPNAPVLGCDTGPGNTLMDAWICRNLGRLVDTDGRWAAQGSINEQLLDTLLEDPWFARSLPKSTGRELFNLRWLDEKLARCATKIPPVDVQATLAELTAVSIIRTIEIAAPDCERAIICGGGVHNEHLMRRLRENARYAVESTQQHGAAPDWIEGLAFAWLARARLLGLPGNVPSVTGAHEHAVLGGIYSGRH